MQDPMRSMQGKVCLITGATSGVGEATALALARLGTTTILIGRDLSKGKAVVERIKTLAPNSQAAFLQADLSSLAQVRALAAQFTSQYDCLHVLVNNAGAMLARRQESVDGIEMTFALNHLGPFLLTNLLLDTLKASTPARIINISSVVHVQARLDLDDLQCRKRYSGMMPYNRSKLANLLFTYDLARRLEGTRVTVNAVGLGLTRSGLYRRQNIGWFLSLMMRLMTLAAPTAEKAADTIVDLVTNPDLAAVTGKYFVNGGVVPSSQDSYDRTIGDQLWQASTELTGLALPACG
jgi:retinol dehydrogenase 12